MDAPTRVLLIGAIAQFLVGCVSVYAIFRAPIVALKLQGEDEERKRLKERQLALFRTLMTYRATPLAVPFVQALNSIDLEFRSQNGTDKQIRNAWTALLDHFNNDNATAPEFGDRTRELIVGLLSDMSTALGYSFDAVYIKRHSYYPMAHGSIEEEQTQLRHLLLDLLRTNRRLPVAIFEEKFPDLQ